MPVDRHSNLIRPPRRVPVETLREAVERSGLSHVEIARRMGWMRSDKPTPDGRRVARTLGLRSQDNGHGYGFSARRAVNSETAARLLAVLSSEELRDARAEPQIRLSERADGEPAWRCPVCGYESFCGYFASKTVCPKCPHRPEMERAWNA